MLEPLERPNDDLRLKQIITLLCSSNIRQPLSMEIIRRWLNQFTEGEEKTVGLLILRNLIYRTSKQMESSLKQALKRAALHFVSADAKEHAIWKDIVRGVKGDFQLLFGPPSHLYTRPGKSGELMARLLTTRFDVKPEQMHYPESFTTIAETERYLLIDDGTFTGEQLGTFIAGPGAFMKNTNRAGIVVALAHEKALSKFSVEHPDIPVFFGERMTMQGSFQELCKVWLTDGTWPYPNSDPLVVYKKIVEDKAKFKKPQPLGFGDLGLLVAYEHGIPDDSLQLLWDKSETWAPLINR